MLHAPGRSSAREALVELLGAGRRAIPVIEALDHRRLSSGSSRVGAGPQPAAAQRLPPLHRRPPPLRGGGQAAALTGTVSGPTCCWSALLHDIGKGHAGDHTEVGIRLMATIAPRMGFDAERRRHPRRPLCATTSCSPRSPPGATCPTTRDAGVAEAVGSLPHPDAARRPQRGRRGPPVRGWKRMEGRAAGHPGRAGRRRPAGARDGGARLPRRRGESCSRRATVVRGPATACSSSADRPGVVGRVAGALPPGLAVLSADAATDGMGRRPPAGSSSDGDTVDWDRVAVDVGRASTAAWPSRPAWPSGPGSRCGAGRRSPRWRRRRRAPRQRRLRHLDRGGGARRTGLRSSTA